MPKKISICFRDDFALGEFARFEVIVIQTLSAEFPGFIVHTDLVVKFRERFVVYVYGLWGSDDGAAQALAGAADKTVERLLSNIGWRNSSQTIDPPVASPVEEDLLSIPEETQE
jgi:hypothetical protein